MASDAAVRGLLTCKSTWHNVTESEAILPVLTLTHAETVTAVGVDA